MSSITEVGIFRPKTTREVSMEDLRHAYLAFYDALEKRGVNFASVQDDDGFHDNFFLYLEEAFGWPEYKSFN